tara:strand:- start:4166 stop:5473 length:1308 start_codon:yes stop_codon:yes gene_type:complete
MSNVKLSTWLSTSLADGLDSGTTINIVQSEIIKLDSNTSGDYVRQLTDGGGMEIVPTGARNQDVIIRVDSSEIPTLTNTKTLTNKTINLTNNTLVGTIGQFNAALSGANFVSIDGIETLTNKTLNSATLSVPAITGGSITDISTFGMRDVTNTNYMTKLVSNNAVAGAALTAHRTITLDVRNEDRAVTLQGDLTLKGDFVIDSAKDVTLTPTDTTSLTLPTSGVLTSKDSADGKLSVKYLARTSQTGVAGTYGSAAFVPKINVDASGFIDSIGVVPINSVSTLTFDSANKTMSIGTAGGDTLNARIGLSGFSTTDLSEGSNEYYTDAKVRAAISITDAGGDGSLGYNSGTGVITYTGPSASDVRAHFTGGTGIGLSSGDIKIDSAELTSLYGATIFTDLKTRDGTGTGLDADLLDGQHGSYYRINIYNKAGSLLN